jgi:hypothetical protein
LRIGVDLDGTGFHHLALLAVLAAVSACDAPQRNSEPAPPKTPAQEVAKALTKQQLGALSERCTRMSREQFRRAWRDGAEITAQGKTTAEFTNHYNAKLKTCFYLLTVASAGSFRKMLFDINGGELYGEYQGPADFDAPAAVRPKTCRVESLYCASGGEWQVLVAPYMED